MALNPQTMMQIMMKISEFKTNHPRFFAFVQTMVKPGIPEGTIIEVTVTKPGQNPVTSNIKVQQADIDLIEGLKNIGI